MGIFLNECSFTGQFQNRVDAELPFRNLLSTLLLIESAGLTLFYRSNLLADYCVHGAEKCVATINRIPDKSFATSFFDLIFNRLNTIDWTLDSLSRHDSYSWNGKDVSQTTMAEAGERVLIGDEPFGSLVNLGCSDFDDFDEVLISKNQKETVNVGCVITRAKLAAVLTALGVLREEFDPGNMVAPRDCQTVLSDATRFRRTNRQENGRNVYQEIENKRFWYVDSFHKGGGYHLEVFDGRGKHLGEADLDGNLDPATADNTKHYDE